MVEESNSTSANKTSPWPVLVAVGFALSEVGVFLGLRPVSVAGLLLFVGAVAGILTDSGYVTQISISVAIQGLILVILGAVLILEEQTGTTVRGQSVVLAGALSLMGAILWAWFARRRSRTVSATESSETTSD
jgi:membrane-bound ClpP family serine protease